MRRNRLTRKLKRLTVVGLMLAATHASAEQLCSAVRGPSNTSGLIQTTTGQLLHYSGFTRSFPLDRLEDQLKRLNAAFKARGISLFVVPVPHAPMIYAHELDQNDPALKEFTIEHGFDEKAVAANFDAMMAQMRRYGLRGINILPVVQGYKPGANGERFYYANDTHWTSSAADVAAQFVAAQIKREATDLVADLPRSEIDLAPNGAFPNHGFSAYIAEKCPGVNIPIPKGQLLKVVPKGQAEVGLLDDEAVQVVLFGDSFSAVNRNFDYFLHKYLQADVLNTSVSGGAFFDSMTSYFISLRPGDEPAKLAIWQYLNTLPAAEPFRQLIPSIHGECADRDALARTEAADLSKAPLTMTVDPKTGVTGHKYFAYFEAGDLGLKKFDVRVDYADGKSETVPVARSLRVKNNGRYFLEFSDALKGAVSKVTLTAPADAKGALKAKICRI